MSDLEARDKDAMMQLEYDPVTHGIRLIEYADQLLGKIFPEKLNGYKIHHTSYIRNYRFHIDVAATKPMYATERFDVVADIALEALDNEELALCFFNILETEIQKLYDSVVESLASEKILQIETGGDTNG